MTMLVVTSMAWVPETCLDQLGYEERKDIQTHMQKSWGPVDCAQSDGLEPTMQHLELTPGTSALLLGPTQQGEVQESG